MHAAPRLIGVERVRAYDRSLSAEQSMLVELADNVGSELGDATRF